jgi:hypothetical protein
MQAGSDRGSEWSTDDQGKLMVSSRSVASEQHVRGSRGQKRQCQDHGEKSWRATVQTRSHGVIKLLNHHLHMYLSSRTLPANCQATTATIPSILYCTVRSLPTPTGAVLLIIRGQTVSFPVGSSHKTTARKSARRVNSYLDTLVSTYTAGRQSCCSDPAIVAAPPRNVRRELAVLVYLVKRIEGG